MDSLRKGSGTDDKTPNHNLNFIASPPDSIPRRRKNVQLIPFASRQDCALLYFLFSTRAFEQSGGFGASRGLEGTTSVSFESRQRVCCPPMQQVGTELNTLFTCVFSFTHGICVEIASNIFLAWL